MLQSLRHMVLIFLLIKQRLRKLRMTPLLTLQLFYSAHLTSNSNFVGKIWTPLQRASCFSDAFIARTVQHFPGKPPVLWFYLLSCFLHAEFWSPPWSLQPRLSPTFTYSTSPSLMVSTRSSNICLLVGSSTTCVKKLSSMLCRKLCVCLAVWSFQQKG